MPNNHLDFGVDLLPATTNSYNLGTNEKIWKNIYAQTVYSNGTEVSVTSHTHTLSLSQTGTATVNLTANTVYTLTAGGNTIVFKTPADNNTWTAMVGATVSSDGSVGYVNAVPPSDGYNTKFLRADGTWAVPTYASAAYGITKQYGIAYYSNTSGAFAATDAGTNGHVLIGKGNSAAPDWYEGLVLSSSTANNTTTYDASFSGAVSIATTLSVAGATTLSSTLDVTGETTLSNNLNVTGATALSSTLTVTSETNLNDILNVSGNTTIGTSNSAKSLKVYGTLEVTSTSKLTGNVGIGAASDANAKLYVEGLTKIKGNLVPHTNNTYNLGDDSTPLRWKALFVGTDNSYGDANTPVYWNSGVPTAVSVIQQASFSIANGGTETTISTGIGANTKVIAIVVKNGISYLNNKIGWEIVNSNSIKLSTTATSGIVSGYILYIKK